jgi:hypothetical protein
MSEARVHIDADPEVVYGLVADVTRMGEWSPETVSADWLDGATEATPGARFKGKNKRKLSWSTTCTVTAADPGRELAFDVGKGETRWRYRFEPADGGTDVTESFEIVRAPGGIGRFFTRLATGSTWDERDADLVAGMDTTLANLKTAAER